jgi:hypothetical protein
MATVTPNFNWPVPTSTDLVKDGATAIEALGDSIDASMVDLKGGTTGQVLSKNSNTDMDFVWVTDAAGDITGVTAGTGISGGGTSGTVTVTNSMATAIDAKGDLVPGTGADTFARLAVGANGTVLTADSAETTGLKWATPGGMTLLSTTTLSGASTTITGISTAYTNLYVYTFGMTNNTANGLFKIEINSSTNGIYANAIQNGTVSDLDGTFLSSGSNLDRALANSTYSLYIDDYASTYNFKPINFYGLGYGASYQGTTISGGFFGAGSPVTSLKFSNTGGTFSAGTVLVYGVK